MEIQRRWTGREARALREAKRMSVRGFADFLGVADRTISNWEEGGGAKVIRRQESQALLDTAFGQASEEERERFHQLLASDLRRSSPDVPFVFVPPLEPILIDRPSDHDSALALLAEAASADGISVMAIAGPGGFGKTTLATQVARDTRIGDLFPEVAWVETGEECTPAKVVELISDLCFHLEGVRPALQDPEQAGFHLARIMADRRLLLVIDNVWSAADLQPFLLGAPYCVRLVTTRNIRVCPTGSRVLRLGPMSAREVTELITRSVPALTSANAEGLADLCCGWPLLASVVGANLSQDLQSGASASRAVALAAQALQLHGPSAFDVWDGDQRRNAIGHAITASLSSLDTSVNIGGVSDLRERYLSLAIFPASIPIPITILVRWWKDHGWSSSTVRQFCRILADRSLISAYLADRDAVVLHDVFRAYLRNLVSDGWSNLHQSLLTAVCPESGSWNELSREELYLWRHLSYHLTEAGQTDQLVNTFADRKFVAAKAYLCGYQSLRADLQFVKTVNPQELATSDDQQLPLALALTGHGYLLHGLASSDDISNTLDVTMMRAGLSVPLDAVSGSAMRVQAVRPPQDAIGSGHIGAVVSVDVQGNLLVSAGEDGLIRLWDLSSGRLHAELRGHTGWVYTSVIAPGGNQVASAGEDGLIRLWDVSSRSQLAVLAGHTRRIRTVAFTADGRTLVSGAEDGQIIVWDVNKRIPQRRFTTAGTPVWSVTVINDDMVAAGGEDEYVRLYDLKTGLLLDEQAGHRDWVRSVSASSAIFVSGSGDRSICVWDASTRRLILQRRNPDLPDRVRAVALSADGRLAIAACEDATLRAFSAHGPAGTVAMPEGVDWIRAITRVDDGSVIAGCEDGAIRRWMTTAATEPALFAEGRNTAWAVTTADRGNLAALGHGDGTVLVYEEATMAVRRRIDAGPGRVWTLASGGGYLAAASGDGAIRVWSLSSDDFELVLNTDMRRSWAVAISSDGALLAGSDHRGHTRLWCLPTGGLLWDQNVGAGRLRSLAFSGQGHRLAACGGDGTVVVWDAVSGETVAEIPNKGAWARSVALDGDGTKALIGMGTGEVSVFDLETQQTISELAGHTGRVLLVGFTASTDRIVSAAADGTARLWSVSSQQEVAQVRADTSGQCAAYDSASGKLLVVGANGTTSLTINVGSQP